MIVAKVSQYLKRKVNMFEKYSKTDVFELSINVYIDVKQTGNALKANETFW